MKAAAWLMAAVTLAACGVVDMEVRAEDCTCVPYYQCDKDGFVVQGSEGIIDIAVQDDQCDHYLDVCCKQPNDEPTPPVTNREPGACGRRNAEGVGLQIASLKDGEAQFGEFPWMAAVLREETTGQGGKQSSYICGGSLIHPQIVLTAAHCFRKLGNDQLLVRLGEWDTQTTKEPLPAQERRVSRIVLHPEYRDPTLHNDAALLFLESPVSLADNVDVVCLPPQGAVIDHQSCYASGWGKDVFGKEDRYSVVLKKEELPMVPHAECTERLRQTRLGARFTLHESFVCAGGVPESDTCRGDGGSPLVCPLANDPTRYVQAGIVAWGIGCGGEVPAVYANVAAFREWIDQQLLYANLNATYIP